MDISPYVGGKSSVEGRDNIIKLSSNENPYGASAKSIEVYKNVASNLNRYPDGGCEKLRNIIADVHNLTSDNIICGNGSDELIGLLVQAYAGVDDEVLYTEHAFLMYKIYAQSCGATPVSSKEENLTANVNNLLAKVSDKTRIVFIANPNNPTGSYISKSEMKRLRDGLRSNIILAIDNAYAEYVTQANYSDGRELVDSSNTIILHTFSKLYGLAGLRIGWAYANANIIDVLNRVRSPFNVNISAQEAACASMLDIDYANDMAQRNIENREFLATELTSLGYETLPSVANFLLVKFSSNEQKNKINNHLLNEGIIVRDVSKYGLAEYLRITVGRKQDNIALIEAIKRYEEF